jgi:glutathione S-transferase
MMSASYTLVIGTKAWSSWSLRPWLVMTWAGISFEEIEIALRGPATETEIARHSPSGKVPVLKRSDGLTIWDSLAIAEYLAESHPEKRLWPAEARTRAEARAVSCEMHSSYQALRTEMPMDFAARHPTPALSEAALHDIARIRRIWTGARTAYGAQGPFLFGAFCIADAMYAPVVSRFRSYGIALSPDEQRYADGIWSLPGMRSWLQGCTAGAGAHP